MGNLQVVSPSLENVRPGETITTRFTLNNVQKAFNQTYKGNVDVPDQSYWDSRKCFEVSTTPRNVCKVKYRVIRTSDGKVVKGFQTYAPCTWHADPDRRSVPPCTAPRTINGFSARTDDSKGPTYSFDVDLPSQMKSGTHVVELVAYSYDDTKCKWEKEGVDYHTFDVSVPSPSFNITNLSFPDKMVAGEEIAVDVTVENVGDAAGTANMSLKVSGRERDTSKLYVNKGDAKSTSMYFTVGEPGDYEVCVELV